MCHQRLDHERPQPRKVRIVKSLLKETLIQVGFDEKDARDLDKLVELERRERRDLTIGRATLIREHAMPSIRKRLADLTAEPATTR